MNGKCFTQRKVEPEISYFGRTETSNLIMAETFPARAGGVRLLLWVGTHVMVTATFENRESALAYAKEKAMKLRKTRNIQIALKPEPKEKPVQPTGQLPMFAEAV